jgi:GrpB-like predicted nucleotidyltransferase (UPF0157 family)
MPSQATSVASDQAQLPEIDLQLDPRFPVAEVPEDGRQRIASNEALRKRLRSAIGRSGSRRSLTVRLGPREVGCRNSQERSGMALPDPSNAAAYDKELAKYTIGGLKPLTGPITLCDYDPVWPESYRAEEDRIRSVLGDRVFRIEHAGSTSVPGLPAKPVIDIVLEVSDSGDEAAYLPDMEAAGYMLRIREADWFEHRVFKGPGADINLHTFSAACPEVDRMLLFRDWLRQDVADRELYANTKRELAARKWKYMQQYADAKTAVVLEIMARAIGDRSAGVPGR